MARLEVTDPERPISHLRVCLEVGEGRKYLELTWMRTLSKPILKNATQGKIVTISSRAQNFTVTTNIHRISKTNNMSNFYPKQRANVPIYKELLQINKKNSQEGRNWTEVTNRKECLNLGKSAPISRLTTEMEIKAAV